MNKDNLLEKVKEAGFKSLDDFVKAAGPKKINIVGDFRPRGGIQTSVEAKWEK